MDIVFISNAPINTVKKISNKAVSSNAKYSMLLLRKSNKRLCPALTHLTLSLQTNMKKILLSLFFAAICAMSMNAANILSAKSAKMEGPASMSYNADMSHNLGMDVFVSHDQTTAIAIGSDNLAKGSTPKAFISDMAKSMNINTATIRSLKLNNGTLVTAHTDSGERTIGVFNSQGSNKLVVILFMGAIPVNEAISYMKTIQPLAR
jgi:hypothetical protein